MSRARASLQQPCDTYPARGPQTTREQLIEAFSAYGAVTISGPFFNERGGICYVDYSSKEEANAAMAGLNAYVAAPHACRAVLGG